VADHKAVYVSRTFYDQRAPFFGADSYKDILMTDYPLLRRGSKNTYVADVQAELNTVVTPYPGLVVDGIFGWRTQQAVKRFQAQNPPLAVDGIVGPNTHGVLFPNGDPQPIFHPIRMIAQPTETSCWAAATAMMTGTSVKQVINSTPDSMIRDDGTLKNHSGGNNGIIEGTRYARLHGLRCNPPMTWTPALLRNTLRQTPLMFDMLWDDAAYTNNRPSQGHMVVAAGCTGIGANMQITVYDPYPARRGTRRLVDYGEWVRTTPAQAYRVFEWGRTAAG